MEEERKEAKVVSYLDGRIDSMLDEARKANSPEDRAWLNRVAQELDWARMVMLGQYSYECVLAEDREYA